MRILSLLLLAPAVIAAQEVSLKVDQLPPAIRAAVSKRFPNAPITGASKETEDGKTSYEVSVKVDGKNVDITASTAGQITLIERAISKTDLPAAVAKAIDTKHPSAKYGTTESVWTVSATGETLSYYEVVVTDTDKQRWELEVAPDGSKIIKTEKLKPAK